MFASGPISADFVIELLKLVELQRSGLAKAILLDELQKIEAGTFDGFGNNKSTIEIVDNDLFVAELMIVRRTEEESKETIQSVAYETLMMPVYGAMRLFQYQIDATGAIAGDATPVLDGQDGLFLFAKTSDSRKLYRFLPIDEIAILLSATWKKDPDDYYVTYDRASLKRIEVVSTHARESRVQFWLTFYAALREDLSADMIATLSSEAETVKLRSYLTELIQADVTPNA
jgi:hypothetical protein